MIAELRDALAGSARPCCRPSRAPARPRWCRCGCSASPGWATAGSSCWNPGGSRPGRRQPAWRELLGEEVGATVGYVTRDDRRIGRHTRVEVVTDGILTRRLQRDRHWPGTALVVFDEFHERHLQADLGLALTLDAREGLRPTCGCW